MWWDHGSGWAFVVMSFGMIALLALIGWAVVGIGRNADPDDHSARPDDSYQTPTTGAEQILAERLARGQIDTAEYRRRLAEFRQPQMTGTTP